MEYFLSHDFHFSKIPTPPHPEWCQWKRALRRGQRVFFAYVINSEIYRHNMAWYENR